MNWEAIGAIGEIVSALAVFLTLAYLAIQIRQNTKAVQSSAFDSSVSGITAMRKSLSEDAELASIYLKGGNAPESLSEIETLQYRLLMHNVFLAFSNTFSQVKFTKLTSSNWESQKPSILRMLESPGSRWFWEAHREEFETEFRKEIDKLFEGY